jgi:divalent metal cation (Fe/Co/Zn/Cd) transporter
MKTIVHRHPHLASHRDTDIQAGVRIEMVTIGWMLIEAAVAIGAGIGAHSVLLTAFGADSVIELLSGGALLWRLQTEARGGSLERVEWAENRAAWIAGVALAVLCAYIVVTSMAGLWLHNLPERSPLGLGLAMAAVIIMPVLFRRKRTIAAHLNSAALRADAACSLTCAYMAGTLLVGLGLTAALGWWWADSVAALVLLIFIVPEARETLESARAGRGGCPCGHTN